ncbi:MAG: TIGR02301 family protein [Pseudomonadota bacterium]
MVKLFSVLLALLVAAPAAAQTFEDYERRKKNLSALSAVFGELHHIRRQCDPRFESDTWRDGMKKLIELEQPDAKTEEAMILAFNNGYAKTQRRFPSCNRNARDFAAVRAADAQTLVGRLAEPLQATLRDNDRSTVVLRP